MGSIEQTFDVAEALAKYDVDVHTLLAESHTADNAVASLYPKQIVNASEHEEWSKGLWSVYQREAKPTLVFQPKAAKEIAITLLLCRHTNTKFAVKSGGHAAMKGASSADGGITIDLKNLNGVDLNEDKSIVQIGAGNQWERVYTILAKDNLAVAGGRAGDVGVGGYSLGGGISFFASQRGWGCDNIRTYELVTAEGEILSVTHQSHPDLFWALRGGGNNFGIVTRFDYETFSQGDIFAGNVVYEEAQKVEVVKAFSSYAYNADPKAATWLTAALSKGKKLLVGLAMYADPNPDAAFVQPYLTIPSLHSGAKVRSVSDMTHEIAESNVKHHRQNYSNYTFKFDADFVSWLVDSFWATTEPHHEKFETEQGSIMVFQIYTKESIALMKRDGGNCLGLREEDAPYLNVLIPSAWFHEKDDELVLGLIDRNFELAIEEGKRRGLYVDFMYMNYSSCYQDALKGYGEENYERLRAIAKKYDPESIFQTLVPGFFKFGGPSAKRS